MNSAQILPSIQTGTRGGYVKKKIMAMALFVMLIFLVAPAALRTVSAKANETVTVTHEIVYIRSGPGLSYPIIGEALQNETFAVLQKDGDWRQIRMPSGDAGWIAGWLVEESSNKTTQSAKMGVVTADILRVRESPDLTAPVVSSLAKNIEVTVTEMHNGWAHIESGSVSGWTSSQYVHTGKNKNTGEAAEGGLSASIVAASKLNIRKSPSLHGETVATASYGTRLQITGADHGWYEVVLDNGTHGWVAGYYVEHENQVEKAENVEKVKLLYDHTNLRSQPLSSAPAVARGNAGESYPVIKQAGDWYEIRLNSGATAYVASWVVQTSRPAGKNRPGLKGKTIVIDPGHGGFDNGTTGAGGTLEKLVTLKTANALYKKLVNAGAKVILTRDSDTYVSLPQRVAVSNANHADAFVSIHFDSSEDESISGHTTYYYHPRDFTLASIVSKNISRLIGTNDRGVKFGDFHVIRENEQPAILLELGYLSNPKEEKLILGKSFQTKAVTGIYDGLQQYFQ